MLHRITKLELTNFRGATQPVAVHFDSKKSIVVIFGENGTGKSTLVDAIDAIGNATFGSLVREGVSTPQKYVTSLNQPVASLEVELTTKSGNSWKATVKGRTITVADGTISDPRVLPDIQVLRRRELLKLIEAKPAERYVAIQGFIEVAGVDKAEAALRADFNAVEEQVGNAGAARAQAEKTLQALWEQQKQGHETEATPLDWAERRIAENLTAIQTQLDHLALLHTESHRLTDATTSWNQARDLRSDWTQKLTEAEAELAATSGSEDTRRSDLIGLLKSAKSYLALPAEPAACPLCTNEIEADELRQRIENQLTQLQAASEQLQKVNGAKTKLTQATDEEGRCNREVLRQFKIVSGALLAYEPAAVWELGTDWIQLSIDLQTAAASDATSEKAAALAKQLTATSAATQSEVARLQTRLTLHENVKTQAALLKESTAEVEDLTKIFERLGKVKELVVSTRRAFIQGILDELIGEVNRLFEAIHPGEKIGLHRLEMDEEKRASLEQHARFEGVEGVIPQAYFSESHLDTFGFCLWLALTKRLNTKEVILVLDDVFTSVDTQHFRRISDLLADEAQHFQQIIIATHNRLWHDYYKTTGVNAHLIKLERWTLSRGLRAHQDQILVTELAEALAADTFDRQAVASKAGVLLENVLDNLAMYYGCSMKRKPGHAYTLGDLLDGTKGLLKKAEIKRVLRDIGGAPEAPDKPEGWHSFPLEPHFKRLDALKFIRNEVGAHFNPAGADWSDSDVSEFGQAAYELAEALACQTCGHMPKNMRTDHRGCRCENHQTQLRPLTLN